MVDDLVIALRPQRVWSSLVAWDLFLSGTGAGLFFLALFLPVLGNISQSVSVLAAWLGLALVCAGGVVLAADLGTPFRLLLVFRRPHVSWVSRGAWTMLLFLGAGGLALLPSLPGLQALPWRTGTPAGAVLEVLALALAFALMTYTGLLLSSWNAIPFWNTPLLPTLFVASSLLGGAGVLLGLAVTEGTENTTLGWLALFLIFAVSFHLLLYVMVMRGGTSAARESVRLLLFGRESRGFVGGVALLGLLLPIVLLLAELGLSLTGAAVPTAVTVAIVIGTYQLRSAILKAGVFRA